MLHERQSRYCRSVQELRDWQIDFHTILPYIMALHQKSVEDNTDLKTANNLIHDIREYRRLGTLQDTIKHLEERGL
jgi:hypothetical protein